MAGSLGGSFVEVDISASHGQLASIESLLTAVLAVVGDSQTL